MKLSILEKIERNAPRLSELIEAYRARREERVRAAIVNAILASEVRYLSPDEILYLAWLKAGYDQRMREEHEAVRQRWQDRQRKEYRRMLTPSRKSPAQSNHLRVH